MSLPVLAIENEELSDSVDREIRSLENEYNSIYVVSSSHYMDQSVYKVAATRDSTKSLLSLNRGRAKDPLRIVMLLPTRDALRVEKCIHHIFRNMAIQRKFFYLSAYDLETIRRICAEFSDSI